MKSLKQFLDDAMKQQSNQIDKVASIIEIEYLTPKFRELTKKSKEYDKARYLYVWYLFAELNVERIVIRSTMPCYGYSKTIYQIIKRMYLRRKDTDIKADVQMIKRFLK
jgi:hypothetical protein